MDCLVQQQQQERSPEEPQPQDKQLDASLQPPLHANRPPAQATVVGSAGAALDATEPELTPQKAALMRVLKALHSKVAALGLAQAVATVSHAAALGTVAEAVATVAQAPSIVVSGSAHQILQSYVDVAPGRTVAALNREKRRKLSAAAAPSLSTCCSLPLGVGLDPFSAAGPFMGTVEAGQRVAIEQPAIAAAGGAGEASVVGPPKHAAGVSAFGAAFGSLLSEQPAGVSAFGAAGAPAEASTCQHAAAEQPAGTWADRAAVVQEQTRAALALAESSAAHTNGTGATAPDLGGNWAVQMQAFEGRGDKRRVVLVDVPLPGPLQPGVVPGSFPHTTKAQQWVEWRGRYSSLIREYCCI
jgi:hypothetical protein